MTRHVIVGAGPVATNAIETIRLFDGGTSEITLVSDEPAHSRMALPYWLAGQIPREQTYTGDQAYFEKLKVDARIGVRAERLDVDARQLHLSDGTVLSFDTLLLATGSTPNRPSIPGVDLPGVQTLWTLEDTERLLQATQELRRPRVVLIGAGFVGLIVLTAMFKRGWQLTVVEREEHVLPRMLNAQAASLVERWLTRRGVRVRCGTTVAEIGEVDGRKCVRLENGEELEADVVVVATGVRPNLELVADTPIETDQGILVDDRLQTSVPGIYAGGDVAQGPVLFSDQRQVHAIQPTAVDHGRVAGANMAGHEVHYPGSLLMNVLDCCGLHCASFGHWDNPDAEAMTVSNPGTFIFRQLLWEGDQLTGAIFVGRASDVGLLTDVGMVKGILQTQTPLGPWKEFLRENPFDVRRPFVAAKVPHRLAQTTLLGRPAQPRRFHFGGRRPTTVVGPGHAVLLSTVLAGRRAAETTEADTSELRH